VRVHAIFDAARDFDFEQQSLVRAQDVFAAEFGGREMHRA